MTDNPTTSLAEALAVMIGQQKSGFTEFKRANESIQEMTKACQQDATKRFEQAEKE